MASWYLEMHPFLMSKLCWIQWMSFTLHLDSTSITPSPKSCMLILFLHHVRSFCFIPKGSLLPIQTSNTWDSLSLRMLDLYLPLKPWSIKLKPKLHVSPLSPFLKWVNWICLNQSFWLYPFYVITCYKFPKYLTKNLHSIMSKFCISQPLHSHKLSWDPWATLCLKKTEGGLGLK